MITNRWGAALSASLLVSGLIAMACALAGIPRPLTIEESRSAKGEVFAAVDQEPITATQYFEECENVPGGCSQVGEPCEVHLDPCYYCSGNPTRTSCTVSLSTCEEYTNPFAYPVPCGRSLEGICSAAGFCEPFNPASPFSCGVVYDECL